MGLTRPRAYQIFDIDYKQSVRVITLSNVTLSGGAPTVVDSVTLSAGDRVLVAGQNTGSQNGLYQVSVLGTGSNGTWIRSVDGNQTGEIDAGMIVMVTEGDVYKDTQWKLTTNDPIIIGVTALTFEQNSAFAFGNIFANGTAVLADIVGDTVTFTPGNNFIITGNATSDTVTFAVSESPTFTGNVSGSNLTTAGQVSATGNITGGNLLTAGMGSFGTTVSATGNITGGNIVSNARIDGGNLYLTSLDANKVVFTGASGQLIDSQNFTFDGVTANIQGVLIVDNVEIDSNSISSTVGNLLLEAPFVSVQGNVIASGIVSSNNNLIVNSTGGEGGQLVMAWAGVNGLTGQANSTWNLDVDSSNNLRAFSVNAVGTANVILNVNSATRETTVGGNLLPSANITYNLGSPTQRWNEIFLAANTIDIGGATISADIETGSLILKGPDGAEFVLTGSSPTDSFGIFGVIEAGNSSPATSTTTGALRVTGGAGIGGNIYAGGNINGPNLVAVSSGIVDGGTLRGTLLLSSGNVLANNLNANLGTFTNTLSATGNANVGNLGTIGSIVATGNITGGNITTGAQVIATGNVNGSNLVTAGIVDSTGNIRTAAQLVSTVQDPTPPLSVASSVTVNNLSVQYLDGYQRSTVAVPLSITARDTNSNVAANSVSVAERVFLTSNSAANIHFANASAITFNTYDASEGVVVSGNNLSAVGNLISNGIVASGNISASYFLGNVACASGIFTTKIFSGNSEVNVASAGGNVTVSVGGSPNIATFVPGGLSVPGTVSSGDLIAANLVQATTGTITGNLSVLGNLIVTGNVSYQNQSDLIISDPTIELGSPANDAPLTSNDGFSRGLKLHYYTTQDEHGFIGLAGPNYDYYQFLIDSTETNSTFTGTYANVSMGNLTATGIAANAAIVATGNVTGGNITTAGQVVAVGNVSGNYIIGNGYNLTDVTTTAISVGNVSLSANATALTFSVAGNTIATVTSQGLIMGAPISMGGRKITGLASPDADGDASNKGYVDGAAGTSNFPVGDYGDLGTAATDSFGIPIAPLTTWDNEDPYGSLETTDLGELT